jgi:hypothetical protein
LKIVELKRRRRRMKLVYLMKRRRRRMKLVYLMIRKKKNNLYVNEMLLNDCK